MSVWRAALACAFACVSTGWGADWQSTLTREPPVFPVVRPLRATYAFGWSGFTAGAGEAHLTRPSQDRLQIEAAGGTSGLVRALWKLDASHHGLSDVETLRPIEAKQIEAYRSKKIITCLTFKGSGVRSERSENDTTKIRDFNFPGVFDLQSAILYFRSQPLKDRNAYRIVVYPGTSAYLATITVLGREKVSIRAGTYNAIKLDLKLSRVGKTFELEPHRKFRRATVWLSDDADRLLLRAEAQIFIGTVFAELQSVHFES